MNTAPSAAPELNPTMSGDASGLLASDWKIPPEIANAAPTMIAVRTRGQAQRLDDELGVVGRVS
jgi:hypothetical protein